MVSHNPATAYPYLLISSHIYSHHIYSSHIYHCRKCSAFNRCYSSQWAAVYHICKPSPHSVPMPGYCILPFAEASKCLSASHIHHCTHQLLANASLYPHIAICWSITLTSYFNCWPYCIPTHQVFICQLLANASSYPPVAGQCTIVPSSCWPMYHRTLQLLAITSIKLIKAIIKLFHRQYFLPKPWAHQLFIFYQWPLYHQFMLVQRGLHLFLLTLKNCWLSLTNQTLSVPQCRLHPLLVSDMQSALLWEMERAWLARLTCLVEIGMCNCLRNNDMFYYGLTNGSLL